MTSDTMPPTKLWELATYELRPRLNRLSGVSTVIVQGGREPEFEVRLDPSRMVQTAVHCAERAGCAAARQHDRFARPV